MEDNNDIPLDEEIILPAPEEPNDVTDKEDTNITFTLGGLPTLEIKPTKDKHVKHDPRGNHRILSESEVKMGKTDDKVPIPLDDSNRTVVFIKASTFNEFFKNSLEAAKAHYRDKLLGIKETIQHGRVITTPDAEPPKKQRKTRSDSSDSFILVD